MKELITTLFSTEKGKELYRSATKAISDYNMNVLLSGGVVVGLSGGADSVALLLVLLRYKVDFDFNIKAVHINHSIRGIEADRDELFSKDLCVRLGVPFESYKIDVPELASKLGVGLEEAAREVRYNKFQQIIDDSCAFSSIAVAHNATDNLETVIFNMMRGSGIVGISGIRPVRDNIIRPLIYASKELIISALSSMGMDFVIDSTNLSTDYTRNYIRNEIIPKFKHLNDSPENMCTRLTTSLREDSELLLDLAKNFLNENEKNGKISIEALSSLKKPLFSRVIMLMCKEHLLPSPEKVHIDAIYSLISDGDFSISLPGGMSFISQHKEAFISDLSDKKTEFYIELHEGENKIPIFSSIILVSKDKNYDCFSNIYKKSIQVKINFDIINNGLYVRSRKDGDSYRFGNMTRKLKKIFNDKKVPASDREKVPVFCDSHGILWVPGLPVRDGTFDGEAWYITILDRANEQTDENKFFVI